MLYANSPSLMSIQVPTFCEEIVCFTIAFNDHLEIVVFLVLELVTTVSSRYYINLI